MEHVEIRRHLERDGTTKPMQASTCDESLRILVVARAPRLTNTGYKQRVAAMAEELVAQGHCVTILCFCPIYDWFGREGLPKDGPRMRVIFVPSLPSGSFSRLLAALSRWQAMLTVWLFTRVFRFEAIQAESALSAVVSQFAKREWLVVDFHGDRVAEVEMSKGQPWLVEMTRRDDQKALQLANAVLCASRPLQHLLNQRAQRSDILSALAPCGVNLNRFAHSAGKRVLTRQQLGLQDRTVLCYLGGISKWQCIEQTIKISIHLRRMDPSVFFLLITPDDIARLRPSLAKIGKEGQDYQHLRLSASEVADTLPAADLGFLLREQSPVNAVASPTKFGEYLAAGVPVLATEFAGDAAAVIRSEGCGHLLPNVDCSAEQIAEIHSFLFSVKNDRDEWFNRCREIASSHQSWQNARDALREVYKPVLPSFRKDQKRKAA